ncbi:MAG: dihydrodipicolinate reductase [Rhodothermales bacterium]|nr:dihydrodipicolinate reductase [Rhodothermales bacterium]
MHKAIRVVQYGIGPIGLESIRTVLSKESTGRVKLVGAIDIDPEKVGKDLADLLHLPEPTGVVVSANAREVLTATNADVVLHTTSSFLASMYQQLIECAEADCHVVSSTEELSYPYDRHPAIADELDAVAKQNGVSIVGTGVNPGYAMDSLALMATGVCTEVLSVSVERVVDAGKRRLPLQNKVGAGITEQAFADRKATGKFGHIGLRESILMVADGLDWKLDAIEESLDPIIAQSTVDTAFLRVDEGSVAGIHHSIKGFISGTCRLSLDLKMYVGADESYDAVIVDGLPPIKLKVEDGIFGDTATIATLVNTIPLAVDAAPGLHTVKDLPPVRAFATKHSTLH